jgi:hypothetical protein
MRNRHAHPEPLQRRRYLAWLADLKKGSPAPMHPEDVVNFLPRGS